MEGSSSSELSSLSDLDSKDRSPSSSIIHNADTCCRFPHVSKQEDSFFPYLFCNSCDHYLGFEEPLPNTPEHQARKGSLLDPIILSPHIPATPTVLPPTPSMSEQPDDSVLMPPPSPPKRRRMNNRNPSTRSQTPVPSPRQSPLSRRARGYYPSTSGRGRARGGKSIAWSTLPPPPMRRALPPSTKSINWTLPAPNIHDGHAPCVSVPPMEPPPPPMPAGIASYRPWPIRYAPYFPPGYGAVQYNPETMGLSPGMTIGEHEGEAAPGGGFNRTGYPAGSVTLTSDTPPTLPPFPQGQSHFHNIWDAEPTAAGQPQEAASASAEADAHFSARSPAQGQPNMYPSPPSAFQSSPYNSRTIDGVIGTPVCPCGAVARLTVVDTSHRGTGPEVEVWVCGLDRCGFYVFA